LDVEESDDGESQGYNSEADEVRKGGRGSKRRRLDDESSGDESSPSDDDEGSLPDDEADSSPDHHKEADVAAAVLPLKAAEDQNNHQTTPAPAHHAHDHKKPKSARAGAKDLPGVSAPIARKNLIASEAAIKKSGVIYLSRIPPYMKPSKLRSLLAPYGQLNRVFLSPEEPAAHARRVKSGGNKKRSYGEGWVEFADKREARAACDLLNARTVGGRKKSFYRDDVWCLRYLRGFKWHHLTEQIAAENAERASRMRAEIARTTRENKEFVRNVERAKMLDGMEAKKAARKRRLEEDGEGESGGASKEGKKQKKRNKDGEDGGLQVEAVGPVERLRTFKQIPLANKKERDDRPEQVQRVLSKIF